MRNPNRRDFLKNAAALALTGAAVTGQPPRPRLNIVFILADDLGWTDLGCYGSRYYQTPNVDRLATQGMRFTNAYAACPVCSPTRASIFTGRYPARLQLTDWIPGRPQWPSARLITPRFRQELPLEELTIPKMLKPEGYRSASIGKWHLGGPGFSPEQQGFDLNIAGTRRGSPASYFGPFDLPGLQNSEKGEFLTERLTEEALKFMEDSRNRPFFLYLPHFTVHLPLQARPEAIAKYQAKTRVDQPQHNPTYAAMVESFDRSVGAVLAKLDDLKIADRTVVFINSDNGGLLYEGRSHDNVTSNRPLRAGKGHLYEGGIREPLIVRWPGVVKAGGACDVPVSSVDYFPTIRDIAGLPPSQEPRLDGLSLMPLLKGASAWRRDALYWHYPHYSNQGGPPAGAVRSGDFKLIEFFEDGKLELYDLAHDPSEQTNLAPVQTQRTAELHGLLKQWRESVGASMPVENPNYDPEKAGQGLTGADRSHQ